MKEAPGSSETSVLTRATWRNNPEDTILQSTLLISVLDVGGWFSFDLGPLYTPGNSTPYAFDGRLSEY
jgi:hypothetical protein